MNYIKWTSSQRDMVTLQLVKLLEDRHTEFELRSAQSLVPTPLVHKLVPDAQKVLPEDIRRKHFSKAELHEFIVSASRELWARQHRLSREDTVLKSLEETVLLDALTLRLSRMIFDRVIERVQPMIAMRVQQLVNDQLDMAIEAKRKHNPVGEATAKPTLPRVVVVGLLDGQATRIKEIFANRAKITTVLSSDYSLIAPNCRDQDVFAMSKFIDHSGQDKARKVARSFQLCNGSVTELKHMIERHLRAI